MLQRNTPDTCHVNIDDHHCQLNTCNKCMIASQLHLSTHNQPLKCLGCSCWSSECGCHAGSSRRWQGTLEEVISWASSKSTGGSSKWSWSLFVCCTVAMYLIVAAAEQFLRIEHPLAVGKNCRIPVVSQVQPVMLQLQHKVISKWPSRRLPMRHLQTYLLKL